MYFTYVLDWLYTVLHIPFPIVVSNNIIGIVTIFDLFMFTFYLGVFIFLIKYIITDNLDFKVGGTDINYSSSSYLPKKFKNINKNKSSKNNKNGKE